MTRRLRYAGGRQSEKESRPLAGLRFDPDPTAVGLDDLLANGQTGAGPLVFLRQVQPPKDPENLAKIAGINADAIVPHVIDYEPLVIGRRGTAAGLGPTARGRVLLRSRRA